jgi:NAD(P)-dependent dehydrogenase (short-subunit alcohol dehydrogenase family)
VAVDPDGSIAEDRSRRWQVQEFEGRVAVITGAASGIGRGLARRCAVEKMRVVVADVDEKGLDEIRGELAAGGSDVLAVKTDVRQPEAVDALAAASLDAFGAVHLVFNNAGVMLGGYAWERSDDDWRWVLEVNLLGTVNGLRTFVPILLEAGESAHIVNTASVGGLMVGPMLSPYIVSKHAVVALTESVYFELQGFDAPVGISVLCPGAVDTGISRSERIRPADRAERAPLRSEAEKDFDQMLSSGVAEGMHPDEVGGIVFEALRAGQFWIYTEDVARYRQSIEGRMQSILSVSDPVYAPEFAEDLLSES